MDPFGLKVYSLKQDNFAGNIGDGLNFFTCEQSILCRENAYIHRILIVFICAEWFIQCIVTMYNSGDNNIINIYLKYFRDFVIQNDLPLFAIYHQVA